MAAPGQRSFLPFRLLQGTAAAVVLFLLLQIVFGLRTTQGPVSSAVLSLGEPVLRLGVAVHRTVEPFWLSVFQAAAMREEIVALRADLLAERLAVEARVASAARDHALERLHQNVPETMGEVRAVPVLLPNYTGRDHFLWIGKGSQNGIERGMVIFGYEGIIGLVEDVRPTMARVRLMTDQRARWGAQIANKSDSGVLYGTGDLTTVELRFERTATDAQVGDLVVSTGMSQSIAPGGIPFGRVAQVTRNRRGEPVAIVELFDTPKELRTVFVEGTRRLAIEGQEGRL